MSETVCVLGAGASREAGAPLMNGFLDEAELLMKANRDLGEDEDFRLVFDGLGQLQLVHSKAELDLDNLECVYAAFDMARMVGRLGNLSSEQVERLPRAIDRVIAKTLEMSIVYPVSDGRVFAPDPYHDFLDLVKALTGRVPSRRCEDVSILTFNYDLCLDYALRMAGLPTEYCLNPESDSGGLKLLKLHGSLNWGQCRKCRKVVAWSLHDYFSRYSLDIWDDTTEVRWALTSQLHELRHCDGADVAGPVVVPPTWNKAHWHGQIESVWRAAANEMADAENIFVFGYSLPPTDQFFRYLYAVGTVGQTRLKRFWVYDPDEDVEGRFLGLLGTGARARFAFDARTFTDAIAALSSKLK